MPSANPVRTTVGGATNAIKSVLHGAHGSVPGARAGGGPTLVPALSNGPTLVPPAGDVAASVGGPGIAPFVGVRTKGLPSAGPSGLPTELAIPESMRSMPMAAKQDPRLRSETYGPIQQRSPTPSASRAHGMSMMMGAGLGAGVGAATSYVTGGNIVQGAAFGGMGGMAMGAGGGQFLARQGRAAMVSSRMKGGKIKSLKNKSSMGNMYGYSSNLSSMLRGMENPANRAMMFGAGGFLGGFMFGGDRTHKRGFNSKRGNSIGR